jgi:hypothetical protein
MRNNPLMASISTVEIIEDNQPLIYQAQNLTAPRGGIFVSEFEQAEKNRLDKDLLLRSQYYFAAQNPSPAGRPKAEKARLVKDCKSPTRSRRLVENVSKRQSLAAFDGYLHRRGVSQVKPQQTTVSQPSVLSTDKMIAHVDELGLVDKSTGEILPAYSNKTAVARLSYRQWSGEYRIRVTTDASPTAPPPQQAGDRVTKFLTSRAAKNILDSGAYVAAVRGGFSTFLTLTFKADARERIINGDSTIGAECSRFFDAIQKMYQRGWSTDNPILKTENGFDCVGACEVVPAAEDKLDYIWVAEAPKNKQGEVNPHCHVLLRWKVEPHLFHDWAQRIEGIWGQGFAKLERIKSPAAASGYMLKALGYLLKGEKNQASDQGEIKGNRYNISKPARALPWENIANFHAEHMASMIGEIKAKMLKRSAPTRFRIGQGYKALDRAIRQKAFFSNTGQCLSLVNKRIKGIETNIKKYKASLRAVPVRANDYIITFKGKYPLKKFLDWAVGERLWNADDVSSAQSPSRLNPNLLTAAVNGVRKTYSRVRNRYLEAEALWCSRLADATPQMRDLEKAATEFYNNLTEYHECSQLAC